MDNVRQAVGLFDGLRRDAFVSCSRMRWSWGHTTDLDITSKVHENFILLVSRIFVDVLCITVTCSVIDRFAASYDETQLLYWCVID